MDNRFTSCFAFNEDGSMSFMVNTKYYNIQDDASCFRLSCGFHGITNAKIDDNYKIMRANLKHLDNNWRVSIDFDEDGKNEFRVYKVFGEYSEV